VVDDAGADAQLAVLLVGGIGECQRQRVALLRAGGVEVGGEFFPVDQSLRIPAGLSCRGGGFRRRGVGDRGGRAARGIVTAGRGQCDGGGGEDGGADTEERGVHGGSCSLGVAARSAAREKS